MHENIVINHGSERKWIWTETEKWDSNRYGGVTSNGWGVIIVMAGDIRSILYTEKLM